MRRQNNVGKHGTLKIQLRSCSQRNALLQCCSKGRFIRIKFDKIGRLTILVDCCLLMILRSIETHCALYSCHSMRKKNQEGKNVIHINIKVTKQEVSPPHSPCLCVCGLAKSTRGAKIYSTVYLGKLPNRSSLAFTLTTTTTTKTTTMTMATHNHRLSQATQNL